MTGHHEQFSTACLQLPAESASFVSRLRIELNTSLYDVNPHKQSWALVHVRVKAEAGAISF